MFWNARGFNRAFVPVAAALRTRRVTAALPLAGVLPLAALAGVAGAVVLSAPQIARAQTAPPADVTGYIPLSGYQSALPTAPMLVVEHNGTKYLFNRTPQKSGNLRTWYEVRTQGSDKVYGTPTRFGFTSTNDDARGQSSVSGDRFTMPYGTVEIDANNLLLVYACPTGNGVPRLSVENIDEMLKSPNGVARYAGPINDNGSDTPQDASSHGIGVVAIPQPGAALGAAKLGLMVAYSSGNAIELRPFKYVNKTINGNGMGKVALPLPSDNPKTNGWGGDVALQLINNPDKKDTAHPFVAYLALLRNDGVQVGRILMSASGSTVSPDAATIQWGMVKTGGSTGLGATITPGFVAINKGLFGDVSIGYVDASHNLREIGLVETAAIKPPDAKSTNAWIKPITLSDKFYAVDRGFPLRNKAKIANKTATADDLTGAHVSTPAQMVYYPDTARAEVVPDPQRPTLSNVYVPVMSSLVYMDTSNQVTQTVSQIGRAARRTINPVAAGKQILVGIIEGPPPYPAVNFSLPDEADFRGTTFAVSSVTSTNKSDSSTNVSASLSNTTMAKWDGKALVGGVGIATEGEWNMGTSKLTEHASSTSVTYSYSQNLTGQGKSAETYQARPEATLITFGVSWAGYAYALVDEKNARIPGVAEFIEVFALPPSTQSRTVYMNPKGVQPGNLYSYMKPDTMTQADWDAKMLTLANNSMINGPQGQRYIENSWAPSGTVKSEYLASSSDTTTNGSSMDMKMLAGITVHEEVETGFLGIVEATTAEAEATALAGTGFSTTASFSKGAGQTQGLTCLTDIRGNALYGGCTGFGYQVYQLKPDNKYTKELFSKANDSTGLVTSSWPTNQTYKAANQAILDSIDPNSAPWKITYVVTRAEIYPVDPTPFATPAPAAISAQAKLSAPDGALAAQTAQLAAAPTDASKAAAKTAGSALPASLKSKLDAAGLTTPGIIATAYKAATLAAGSQKQGALDALGAVEKMAAKSPNLTGFSTSKATAAMQNLTLDEKKSVEMYLKAKEQEAQEAYLKSSTDAKTKTP